MRLLLFAAVAVLALTIVPVTSARAADPDITKPTVSLDGGKYCTVFACRVEVDGLSIELTTIWGTNGTSTISITGPSIRVIEVPLFHEKPVIFDDTIVGIVRFDDPIVGTLP